MKFYAEIGNPIERTTPSEFRPRRLLTVDKRVPVNNGDVVNCEDAVFLLSLQATFAETKQFKGFEITHRLIWSRVQNAVDLVSGLPKQGQLQILDQDLRADAVRVAASRQVAQAGTYAELVDVDGPFRALVARQRK
jgi:hypothetical protein